MEGKNCIQMPAQHKRTVTMHSNVKKVKRTIEKKKSTSLSAAHRSIWKTQQSNLTWNTSKNTHCIDCSLRARSCVHVNSQVLLAFQLTFCHECGSCLVGYSRYFDNRNVANVSVSRQIGLLSLLDTWMTAHEH